MRLSSLGRSCHWPMVRMVCAVSWLYLMCLFGTYWLLVQWGWSTRMAIEFPQQVDDFLRFMPSVFTLYRRYFHSFKVSDWWKQASWTEFGYAHNQFLFSMALADSRLREKVDKFSQWLTMGWYGLQGVFEIQYIHVLDGHVTCINSSGSSVDMMRNYAAIIQPFYASN